MRSFATDFACVLCARRSTRAVAQPGRPDAALQRLPADATNNLTRSRRPMNSILATTLTLRAAHIVAAAALLLSAATASAQGMCAGQPLCREVAKFSATITEFRVSRNTVGNRPVNVTVRFTNKSAQPLILGYVDKTAAAFDDRGNKYELQNSQQLKGIGRIERNRFDPKFKLAPGESSDARLDVNFFASNVIVGTEFDFEMSVREIEPLPANQYRLGREHALSWQHLKDGMRASAPVAAAPAAAPPSAPAPAPAPGAAAGAVVPPRPPIRARVCPTAPPAGRCWPSWSACSRPRRPATTIW
jgi:hypothetical protein